MHESLHWADIAKCLKEQLSKVTLGPDLESYPKQEQTSPQRNWHNHQIPGTEGTETGMISQNRKRNSQILVGAKEGMPGNLGRQKRRCLLKTWRAPVIGSASIGCVPEPNSTTGTQWEEEYKEQLPSPPPPPAALTLKGERKGIEMQGRMGEATFSISPCLIGTETSLSASGRHLNCTARALADTPRNRTF